jgi:uncharacterized protein (DUF2252 family)
MFGRRAGVLFLLLAAGPLRADGLATDPRDPRLAERPDLVGTIAATPHAYFRFVGVGFAAETCRLFEDVLDAFPEVNLHGDAHVEQYAVTSLGRGLTDFDDCTRGKPVIDLVRFGASLVLAAREKGWAAEEQASVEAFLRGYRSGLKSTRLTLSMPAIALRLRSRFSWDHGPALARARQMIDRAPVPKETFVAPMARAAELIAFSREIPAGFFEIKHIGALSMGIGSALDEKYLVITEGPSPSEEDDLVLEAKQVRDVSGNPCVRSDTGASRVLDGQRLIAYEPFAYAAVVPRGDKWFWVHDWTDDYAETSIADEIRTPKELREVAYDAGVQLGRAHPKSADGTRDRKRINEVDWGVTRHKTRIRRAIRDMADRSEAAWRAFRQAAHPSTLGTAPASATP